MPQRWLERIRDTIADRGRELLGRSGTGDPAELCRKLLAGKGEASSIAIARELLARYQKFETTERCGFFKLLLDEFGPDINAVRRVAREYIDKPDADNLSALLQEIEPPRQELFRRLNMAPNGTAALVSMRADLWACIRTNAHLRAVDSDLRHLLASWFNRGFLNLERIDWKSSAQTLEKLINYESVHEIRGWEDLRRRLADDRRCFAFFHPALPGEPIIFVEVALTNEISDDVAPLLDINSPVADPRKENTAVFYSINNTLVGLRGISFGNFLIKQVLEDLKNELPNLKQFVTLSPIPRLARAIGEILQGNAITGLDRDKLLLQLSDMHSEMTEMTGEEDPGAALAVLLQRLPELPADQCRPVLERLVLIYLTQARYKDGVYDPVAMFHLSNGAILEKINPFANVTDYGMRASYGCMVNYLYDPEQVEANHERFVNEGIIAMSKELQRESQRLEGLAGRS